MMKIVVSFDELPDGTLCDADLDTCVNFPMFEDFLHDKFPTWDIDIAFDMDSAIFDWDTREVHLDMRPV